MSAILFPSIWTPRDRRPHDAKWWTNHLRGLRDRLSIFTTGKPQRSPSTGKVKRKTGGKINRKSATSSACCCGPTCSNCAGSLPANVDLMISGISVCVNICIDRTIQGERPCKITSAPDPNGTISGTPVTPATSPNACNYTPITSGSGSIDNYLSSDTTCAFGATTTSGTFSYHWSIGHGSGFWSCHCTLFLPDSTGLNIFHHVLSYSDPNCAFTSITFTNQLSGCGNSEVGFAGQDGATGGTVVMVPS